VVDLFFGGEIEQITLRDVETLRGLLTRVRVRAKQESQYTASSLDSSGHDQR
jgi:hypothetical protein